MTDEQKVLAIYPTAFCSTLFDENEDECGYAIYDDGGAGKRLGEDGFFRYKAWADAASHLPDAAPSVDDRPIIVDGDYVYGTAGRSPIAEPAKAPIVPENPNSDKHHAALKREPNLCTDCGKDQMVLWSTPSGKRLCDGCFNAWAAAQLPESKPLPSEPQAVKRYELTNFMVDETLTGSFVRYEDYLKLSQLAAKPSEPAEGFEDDEEAASCLFFDVRQHVAREFGHVEGQPISKLFLEGVDAETNQRIRLQLVRLKRNAAKAEKVEESSVGFNEGLEAAATLVEDEGRIPLAARILCLKRELKKRSVGESR